MRILVLGAGGTGGYFGGRLAQSGADVTFLVREGRAAQLDRDGLVIKSPLGDAQFPVAHVTAAQLPALAAGRPFDLVLLSCKAYDLDSAIDAIAPAVGQGTTVMPILNGLLHYPALDARLGADRVLGGLCFISAMKGPEGEVLHLGKAASITFGERSGVHDSPRTLALAALCAQALLGLHVPPELLYVAQHVGVNVVLGFGFGATLRAGHTPLISTLARRVHRNFTPEMALYTRKCTLAWTLYFAVISALSVALYAFAPFDTWAIFANLVSPLTVAVMFGGEYLLRYLLHPEFERASVADAIRSYMHNAAK